MPLWVAVPDKWTTMGSFVLIEAGTEVASPSPARRGAFSRWRLRVKVQIVAGLVVAALGVFVLTKGISYPSDRSTMRIGDLQASVQEQHAVPRWLGIVALAGGVLIVGTGLRSRKT
jgi:hypothetical protein